MTLGSVQMKHVQANFALDELGNNFVHIIGGTNFIFPFLHSPDCPDEGNLEKCFRHKIVIKFFFFISYLLSGFYFKF